MSVRQTVRFDGQVAIVTGAGQGLGRSYVTALTERGGAVVINDLHADACESAATQIRARGGRALACAGDVSQAATAIEMVRRAMEHFGRIDIVINNAGLIRDRTFHKMSREDFDRVIDVHLRGTAYVTHAAWPHLRDQSYGRVVFTTSSSALWGNFGQANYDAAKLGIVGLMQALKLEGASRGVRVNTVAPFASTSMGADFFPDALKNELQPEHVASLVAYLSSEGCEPNGEIFEVGARRIRRVRMLASDGVINDRDHSVEAIAAVMKHVLAAPLTLEYTSVEAALADFVSHFGVAYREIS